MNDDAKKTTIVAVVAIVIVASLLLTYVRDGGDSMDLEGEVFIECDTVITCVGYVAKPLAGGGKKVGDCNEVGNVMTAVQRAWDVAMKI